MALVGKEMITQLAMSGIVEGGTWDSVYREASRKVCTQADPWRGQGGKQRDSRVQIPGSRGSFQARKEG